MPPPPAAGDRGRGDGGLGRPAGRGAAVTVLGERRRPRADRSPANQGRGGYPCTADEQTLADYDALVAGLSERPLAYLHLRGRAPAVPGAAPDSDAIARYRKLLRAPLIANHGFGQESGNAIVEAGIADAVSFGRLFIANPDLVSRFALGQNLAASDRSTHNDGGPCGYTDYPVWSPSGTSR